MDGSCVQFKDPLLVVLIKIQPSADHYTVLLSICGRSRQLGKPEFSRGLFLLFFWLFVCVASNDEISYFFAGDTAWRQGTFFKLSKKKKSFRMGLEDAVFFSLRD